MFHILAVDLNVICILSLVLVFCVMSLFLSHLFLLPVGPMIASSVDPLTVQNFIEIY